MSLSTANLEKALRDWEKFSRGGHLLIDAEIKFVPRSHIRDPYWCEPTPLSDWYRMDPMKQLGIIALWIFFIFMILATLF